MKMIKFLSKTVVVMFVLLFSLFTLNIYNDNKVVKKENKKIEIVEDKIRIEPIIFEEEKQEEETRVFKIEPPEKQISSNNQTIQDINKFYYSNLDDYSKLIYESLEKQRDSLKTGKAVINLPNKIGEIIDKSEDSNNIEAIFSVALNAFEYDNPEIFYLDASKMVLYYEKDIFGRYKIYIKNSEDSKNYLIDYFDNESDVENAQTEIDNVVSNIENNLNSLDDDYSKILYVHDWLAENVKYDETISRKNKDTIYGSLVEGDAVCGGYAKAFKYLMDRLNLNTIIIQGVGTNEQGQENHAWNYIEIDDIWYGMDCTWDDPIIIGDLTYYTQKKYYTYYLKGQKVFNKDHKPFETFYSTNLKINYPELSINNY